MRPGCRPAGSSPAGGPHPGAWDVYEAGAAAVTGQHITLEASAGILGRLVSRLGQYVPGLAGFLLTRAFPPPGIVAQAASELAGAGLHTGQAATVTSYAAAVRDGQLTLDRSAEPGGSRRLGAYSFTWSRNVPRELPAPLSQPTATSTTWAAPSGAVNT